jgi:hypothetical protein
MITTETVSSTVPNLQGMSLTELAALSTETVNQALQRVLPVASVTVPQPKFNSTI